MINFFDLLPDLLKATLVKTGATLVTAGAKGVFAHLTGRERREVAKAIAAAIAQTLSEYPELEDIGGFARWLARSPASDAFLAVLSKPHLDPDPVLLAQDLVSSEYDPTTFGVELPLLVATLREKFLDALYRNPKTDRIHAALVQREQTETIQLVVDYQRSFHASLQKIEAAVTSPASPRGVKPFTAPDCPPGFVERPAVFEQLRSELLGTQASKVAITTALQGAGGFGKTTLAIALCHDEAVRREFEDGILWVKLGESPDVAVKLAEIYSALTGERPAFVSADDAETAVADELEGRRCLVVIDDVWRPEHLRPFLRGGKQCVRLVTTRHLHVVGDAVPVQVDEMTGPEAMRLLESKLTNTAGHQDAVRNLADRLGGWPLLLELTGSTLRNRMRLREDLRGALAFVERQFDRKGPTAFDLQDTSDRAMALGLTVELSLKQLRTRDRHELLELSIFPDDVSIPLLTIARLWNITDTEADERLYLLHDLSLLHYDPRAATVRLHDVMRAYFAAKLAEEDDPSAVHLRLLDAYKAYLPSGEEGPAAHLLPSRTAEWWRLPPNEPYVWVNLAHHLLSANLGDELRRLLFDCRWLEAKIRAAGLPSVLSDFEVLPSDGEQSMVAGALRLSGHVLTNDPGQLRPQIIGRLLGIDRPEVRTLVCEAAMGHYEPWLRPIVSGLIPPTGALLRTLVGHKRGVEAVAVTPDSHRAVSASNDGTLKVWNLETGVEERTLAGQDGLVAVAVTPDGRRAVSAPFVGPLQVWDLETGAAEHAFAGHKHGVRAVGVTPDGRRAISASDDGTLKVWNLETGLEERTLTGHEDLVLAVAFTPDGHAVSASADKTLKVWDLETGSEECTLAGHVSMVEAVAVTPDGRHIVSGADDGLKVWDLERREEERTLTDAGWVKAVAVTPDSRRAVSASDNTLTVWNLETGTKVCTLGDHATLVLGVAVSPDGRRAVSACWDGTLKVWSLEIEASEERPTARHAEGVSALTITRDGRRAVSASFDSTLKVWNLETGAEEERTLMGHGGWVLDVAVTTDDRRAVSASADGTLKVWDLETGAEEHTLVVSYELVVEEGRFVPPDLVMAVAITPDGRRAVSASLRGPLKVWNFETWSEERTLTGHEHRVRTMGVTPDGRRAVSAYEDGTLKVWNLETGSEERTLQVHKGPVMDMAFTSDGCVICACEDSTLKVWDLKTGSEERTLEVHVGLGQALAVTPDGRHVVSGSYDGTLRVWDLEQSRALATFTVESSICCCAIHPDGVRVVAGDRSGRIHVVMMEGLPSRRT